MKFESHFTLLGSPQAVARAFADVPLVAGFLPGASVEAPNPDGSYPAALVASFGPKRITFKGTLTNVVDAEAMTGALAGQASADVRGARMAVTMNYRLVPAPSSPSSPSEQHAAATEVHLESVAQLTGVLADFAKAGGVIVAEALIAEFAKNFSAHMAAAGAHEAGGAKADARERSTPARTLSVATLSLILLRRLAPWLERWFRGIARR